MPGLRFCLLGMLLSATSAFAVEVAPGDYSQFPDGTTVGLLYYQHATTGSARSHGDKVSSDYNVTSDIGMLRLLHTVQITETATLDPQFLLPFGRHYAESTIYQAAAAFEASGDWKQL